MAEKDGYVKEEKLTSGQSFKRFLYNPSTGEVLGRTGGSWAKILIFYVIFYACLAAFWAVMLLIFYQTIDPHYPKWQLAESRIGDNPGLGFRPRPPEDKVDSTLIWFTSGSRGNWQHWKENLDEYLEPYTQDRSVGKGESVATVDECRNGKQPEKGKYCPFNYKDLFQQQNEKCNKNNNYGYELGTPCILIKLNRIYGWEPKPYTNLPQNIPPVNRTGGQDGIFITCEGENPADKENIGPLRYAPDQLIKTNYFPFTNQPGYLSPFVMVHFMQPSRGILINIECKAWAENISHDRQDREGSVHFELLID
jgi:sodium/potassium-transporting ATPase subunit beta